MFRSFIYLDEEKLYAYKRQVEGKNSPQPKSMSKKKSTGFSAALSGVGLNGAVETSISGDFEKDVSFDYDRFELSLVELNGDDYFDCVLNPDFTITTVPAMKLVRFCSNFEIPEEFDAVNLIEKFKPMLMSQVETKTDNEQDALKNILGNASADIPIILELDDITVSSKLNAKYLHEEYSALEDYFDQEVYVLCKVVGTVQKNYVEIFDPLKDFIRLPRSMRRQMDSNGNDIGLGKILVEGPVLKVEIIAIYK